MSGVVTWGRTHGLGFAGALSGVGLPAQAFARAGAWSLVAYVVCAAVVTLIILCFAEVSSRFDETGGPYLYARTAFGPVIGFEVGWMTWVSRVAAFAANTNLLVAYAVVFVPGVGEGPSRTVAIVGLVAALTASNIAGVRSATVVTAIRPTTTSNCRAKRPSTRREGEGSIWQSPHRII